MFCTARHIIIAVVITSTCYAEGIQNSTRVEPRNLLGIRSAEYSGYLYINPHPRDGSKRKSAAFHIVVPTTVPGQAFAEQSVLCRSAEHFQIARVPEVAAEAPDAVTVGFDGQDEEGVFEDVQLVLEVFPGDNEAVMEARSGETGTRIREKHKARKGDFVLFADDDNWYAPGALDTVRATVHNDRNALYVFKLRYDGYPNTLPDMLYNGEVEIRNIDTGCGVVPVKYVHLADWVGGNSSYSADGRFYHDLSEQLPRTYLIPHVIYIYGHPRWAEYPSAPLAARAFT